MSESGNGRDLASPPVVGPGVVENRNINRIPVRLVVSQKGQSAPLGHTRDLSLHGMFIETRAPLPVGAVLPLSVELEPNKPVSIRAEVVRTTAEGMGLKFHPLDKDVSRRLRQWVVQHTSIEGSRKQVELLRLESSRVDPIRDRDRILRVLEEIRKHGAELTLIPTEGLARCRGRVSRVAADHLRLGVDTSGVLSVGEDYYALLTLSFVSHSFSLRVRAVEGREVVCELPDLIVFSERRGRTRVQAPTGSLIRWRSPADEGAEVELPLVDLSTDGLAFRAPEGALMTVGTVLPGAAVVVDNQQEPLPSAEVRNIRRVVDETGSWLRIGVSVGPDRFARVQTTTPTESRRRPAVARFFDRLRSTFSVLLHKSRERISTSNSAPERVTVRGGALPIVGLLDRTIEGDDRLVAPLVIIVPAFAGRKEQMSYLAGTLVEGFSRQNMDIAVLRLDGTNNLGESGKDPGFDRDGMHTMRFRLSGVIDDLRAALAWAKNNPLVEPSHIVVMSISIASVAVRHFLSRPEGNDVALWVSYMGAAEAVESIRNFSGHVDFDAPFKRGDKLGVLSLGGSLVDGDHFFSDMHKLGIAYMDTALQEIEKIPCDIVWLRGMYDAYIDPRRVDALMRVPAKGRRDVVDVEGGHIPRSGDEALQQFVRITERVWQVVHGHAMPSFSPSVGRLAVRAEAEWNLVRRKSIEDRQAWWRGYLLSDVGPGFDVLEYAREYEELMELQAATAVPEAAPGAPPRRVLELGAGTGNLTRRMLARGATVHAVDLVPEAIEVLVTKTRAHADRLTVAQADLDGSPLVAMRRFIAGDLASPLVLAERVPGVPRAILEQLLAHQGDELHSALRGFGIDVGAFAKRRRLAARAHTLLSDLNLLARCASGRVGFDETRAGLVGIPASVLDQPRGIEQPDGSVDCVVLSLVLSYLDHPDDLLFECYRVLRPGGLFIASSLVRDTESSKLYHGILARLAEISDDELPPSEDPAQMRQRLMDATRRFADHGGELLRLEEEGLFRFYDGPELAARVTRRGFSAPRIDRSFGSPPQAVVVTSRKP